MFRAAFPPLAFITLLCACGSCAGADAARGRLLAIRIGCAACHSIPGISVGPGRAGPPLDHMARRTMIAGVLPNTPDNMSRWLERPQKIAPGRAMFDMQIPRRDAQDIAAYLQTLR